MSSLDELRKVIKLVGIVVFVCTLLASLCMEVAVAKDVHWAESSIKILRELEIGGESMGPICTDEAYLNEPIDPLEWQTWVRQALITRQGTEWVNNEEAAYWIDVYTIASHEGARSLVSRGFCVAGLMKIGNMLGFVSSGGGQFVHLPRFSDWETLQEQGFDGAWELMLEAGIVNGYPDGTLRPKAPLTRAEAACLLATWLDVYRVTLST